MTTPVRVLVLIVAFAFPRIALADPFDDAYDAGTTAFSAKDYPRARVEFLRAYGLRAEPIILFNIAQTYRVENNTKQALDYYRRFVAESKISADLRVKAENYITSLEAAVNKIEEERRQAEANGPKAADGTPITITEPPLTRSSPTNVARPDPAPMDSSGQPSRRPYLVAGVGGAALAGALVLELVARSTYADAKSALDPSSQHASWQRANHQRYGAETLAVTGVAAVGVAVWLRLRDRNHEARTTLAPAVAGDRLGIALVGGF